MLYGWLSKLWCLFGYPKYQVPYYIKDPKRAHNFDNHPDGATTVDDINPGVPLKGSIRVPLGGSLRDLLGFRA